MQKWEYCRVRQGDPVELIRLTPTGPVTEEIGRKGRPRGWSENEEYMRIVAQLGLEGWELVTTTWEYAQLWFKRPVQEG